MQQHLVQYCNGTESTKVTTTKGAMGQVMRITEHYRLYSTACAWCTVILITCPSAPFVVVTFVGSVL